MTPFCEVNTFIFVKTICQKRKAVSEFLNISLDFLHLYWVFFSCIIVRLTNTSQMVYMLGACLSVVKRKSLKDSELLHVGTEHKHKARATSCIIIISNSDWFLCINLFLYFVIVFLMLSLVK